MKAPMTTLLLSYDKCGKSWSLCARIALELHDSVDGSAQVTC